jgi:uncharacterized protein (TIGR03083 family)
VSRPDLTSYAVQERGELLALLRELTPAQWDTPTLCTEWTVRQVATHIVSYDELSKLQTVATFLSGGLRTGKVNDVALRRYEDLDAGGVVDLVARCQRPRGLTAAMGAGIALTDGTIHHQDIRRALGIPRTIPEERLVPVLDFSLAAPTLPSKSNRRGLKLTATDVDWTSGDGNEVTGTGEALLMAVAGRPAALDELEGDGLATLRSRVEGR